MLKKQKSFKEQQSGQHFETIRVGLKQFTISRDIDQFSIVTISKTASNVPYYAILTNHEVVYLFNHKFGINKAEEYNQIILADLCQDQINLRLLYKLPSLLHIKMKYSHNFECVFMLLACGQIAVFTDQFYFMGVLDIICCDSQNSIKHCLDFQYYEKQAFRQVRKIKSGFFVFLFTNSLQVHEVQIVTNHKLSKFKPSYKCNLIQINKQIVDSQINHPVNLKLFSLFKSHLFDNKDSKLNTTLFLSCNCLREVYFYLISKQSMHYQQTIRVSKTHLNNANITDYQISAHNKRFIIGLSNGTLKAISFKEENVSTILYTMKVSPAPINNIYLQSSQKLFAYSKDCVFAILNLNTLSIQQRFKFGQCIHLQFVNEYYFISVGAKCQSSYNKGRQEQYSRTLILNEFHCKYQKIFQCNSDIINYSLDEYGQLIQLSDNSLLINKRLGNKTEVIQTYLPPKSTSVKCISKNPFSITDQYWILTEKSQIYKYIICPKRQVSVSQVTELLQFVDKNQTVHRYTVSYCCFATRMVPMEYDTQTSEKDYNVNEARNQQLMPLCLGTNTGEILIVSTKSVLKIICRIRYLSTSITNIIELHPVLSPHHSKSLLVYQSQRSNKIMMLQMSSDKQPVQLFRFSCQNRSVKYMSKELLGMVNGGAFNIMYCKYVSGQCILNQQEHYHPGVLDKSIITTISYCCDKEKQYVIVGFSLGQILVYCLHRNLQQKTFIHLNLIYVLQSSKEEAVQFVSYHSQQVYFNLGPFLVSTIMNPIEGQTLPVNVTENKRVLKHQEAKQFSFETHTSKPITKRIKQVQYQKQLKLPLIKQTKGRQKRSSSMGVINKSNNQKPEHIFHFPDIQLYRSLINKSMIH